MKIDVKHLWKTKKKLIIGITAGVAAAAIGCGIWYYAGHNSKDPVYVYPFQYIGMTEYWGDSQESHGPVSTDKIQTVFLSDTQEVTEILVQQGDMVKKGDLLMTFDTTLSDLQLERKRLEVEKLKLQQEDAKNDLKEINSMKPMVIPEPSDDPEDEDLGRSIHGEFEISTDKNYDGSTAAKALICWVHSEKNIDDAVFESIQDKASYYQFLNTPEETEPEEGADPDPGTNPDPGADPDPGTNPDPGADPDPGTNPDPETEPDSQAEPETETDPNEPGERSSASAVDYPRVGSFHVVFKVTAGNVLLGNKNVWQGMKVTETDEGFVFRFENVAFYGDHMLTSLGEEDSSDTPEIDYGSGYTAAQIAQMRSDKQKEIKELDFKIKMADAEYKIMQKEVSDGKVYAENDGEVVSLLTEEEAKQTHQPMLKVSGGGGFYVEGFISELEKEKMKPGQEVTVNDWNTGMTYTGSIRHIGDFPTQDGYYNGNGNPNASYYPFQVFVDESADLQAGSYVSVAYSTAETESGIYLENPFLRTEQGKSYVLVLGADGKLEQRWVRTGKSLWGSYTEILEGLTAEDLIAFPYGKNVKPGAAAQEGDMSNLYG